MFLGELMCLVVYFAKKLCCPKKTKTDDNQEIPLSPGTQMAQKTQLKTNINPCLLAIPACFDFCGSTLMFVALTQCAASVYQMMRGIIVVITAGMAMLFLKRPQYLHHFMSLFIIVGAVASVGLVGIAVSNKEQEGNPDGEATTTVLGVLLLLLAQCFTGG
jgi:drug/metabolite transporter (DMT)-like permease